MMDSDIPQIGDKVLYTIYENDEYKDLASRIINIVDADKWLVETAKFIEPIQIKKYNNDWTPIFALPLSFRRNKK